MTDRLKSAQRYHRGKEEGVNGGVGLPCLRSSVATKGVKPTRSNRVVGATVTDVPRDTVVAGSGRPVIPPHRHRVIVAALHHALDLHPDDGVPTSYYGHSAF